MEYSRREVVDSPWSGDYADDLRKEVWIHLADDEVTLELIDLATAVGSLRSRAVRGERPENAGLVAGLPFSRPAPLKLASHCRGDPS